MSVPKCSACFKEVNENENAVFCNISNNWIHANCENLNSEKFELLCQESEDREWACKKCLFKALPFSNCPKKVLNSIAYLIMFLSPIPGRKVQEEV